MHLYEERSAEFPATCWNLISEAKDPSSPQARDSIAESAPPTGIRSMPIFDAWATAPRWPKT